MRVGVVCCFLVWLVVGFGSRLTDTVLIHADNHPAFAACQISHLLATTHFPFCWALAVGFGSLVVVVLVFGVVVWCFGFFLAAPGLTHVPCFLAGSLLACWVGWCWFVFVGGVGGGCLVSLGWQAPFLSAWDIRCVSFAFELQL